MAHAPSTPVRVQRLTALVAICLVAIAVGFAFGRILQGHGATYRMLTVGLASGAIAWATERRGMFLATAVSAAGLLLVVTWFAAPETAWFGLPDSETVRTIGTLATQVGGQAREYVSPAPMTPALLLAGSIAVWAAVFSCYALAFRAQSPLLGLVPPLALIVFADSVLEELVRPLYGVLFLFAALAVLFADALRRLQGWGPIWSPTGNRHRLVPIAGRNARRVGLTAVTLALLAPVFMPGFGQQAVFSLSSINSDHRVRLSPLVSMGAVLNSDDSDAELFSITATAPSYWRMVTLDTNDGITWQPTVDDGVAVASGETIPGVTASGTEVTQTVTILHDGGFSWLVAAATPNSIDIGHDVTWHPTSLSLEMDGWPDAGESYTVRSVRNDPTASDLRVVGTSSEPESLLALPGNIPAVIKQTAEDWTRGLSNDFDRVEAIQRRLSAFDYDTKVSYADDPASLADMLTTTKKGFCQQFASLMAVMLREIGIPARVALGFTTGTPSTTTAGETAYIVHAKNFHAWVEVPFQGFGWEPFDPTPHFPGDPSATYVKGTALPPTCPTQARGCDPSKPGPGQGGGQHNIKGKQDILSSLEQDLQGVTGDLGVSPSSGDTIPVPLGTLALLTIGLAVLVVIAIPFLRAARRRRRLHAARAPRELILATYNVFGERAAELGWAKGAGETPQEYRARLADLDGLGDDGRERLARMTSTVVRAAYAPRDPDEDAPRDTTEDAEVVLHALRDTTSWKQRVLGLYRRD
jgi:transglutaminase-like putative cysteine protease